MKRLLHSLTAVFVAAVVLLAANNANVLAQNASQKEAKGDTTAKVNVDSKGVILKGCDAVAYFKEGKPVKGNPTTESAYQGATYLFA